MLQQSTSVVTGPTFGLEPHHKISPIVVTRVTRRLSSKDQCRSQSLVRLQEEDRIEHRERTQVYPLPSRFEFVVDHDRSDFLGVAIHVKDFP
jgi:hypothetical protein